jgi:hypothetical protein
MQKHIVMLSPLVMESRVPHRGLGNDAGAFAERFVLDRIAGFEKDIDICLTPIPSKTRRGLTHAYFPALASCCGTLEYLSGLYKGRLDTVGWRDVAMWGSKYLPQPDYAEDTVRVFVEAFRNSIAHRGIASGVWIDHKHARRFTWKVLADSRHPAINFVAEENTLVSDPPWPCPYTHRAHIHLRSLFVDIRKGAIKYAKEVREDQNLNRKFFACVRELYPQLK